MLITFAYVYLIGVVLHYILMKQYKIPCALVLHAFWFVDLFVSILVLNSLMLEFLIRFIIKRIRQIRSKKRT